MPNTLTRPFCGTIQVALRVIPHIYAVSLPGTRTALPQTMTDTDDRGTEYTRAHLDYQSRLYLGAAPLVELVDSDTVKIDTIRSDQKMRTILTAVAIMLALTTAARAGDGDGPAIVKKADLPALKGGAVKSAGDAKDGIPTCSAGSRAKISAAEELARAWSSSHDKHACASASVLYVCHVGKNLSVRCE